MKRGLPFLYSALTLYLILASNLINLLEKIRLSEHFASLFTLLTANSSNSINSKHLHLTPCIGPIYLHKRHILLIFFFSKKRTFLFGMCNILIFAGIAGILDAAAMKNTDIGKISEFPSVNENQYLANIHWKRTILKSHVRDMEKQGNKKNVYEKPT